MSRERGESPELFAGIVERHHIDEKFSFPLEHEVDSAGQPIEGQAYWFKFQHESESVEGKLYSPQGKSNDTLVLFEPGMPGDAVGWVEEKHAPEFLKAGYTVVTLRHRGTRTSTEKANTYVHCPERITKGQEAGVATLSDVKEHGVLDLSNEAVIALNILGQKFQKIKLIGHSAGTPYLVHALDKVDPAVKEKITHLVSLSGHVGGKDHFTTTFPGLDKYLEHCAQHLNIGDVGRSVDEFGKVFENIYRTGVPEHIMVTQVTTPGDEYIPPSAAKKFHEFLGRGLLITDQTQTESEFHDLKNLQPTTLLRLLNIYHPKSKQAVTVTRTLPRS